DYYCCSYRTESAWVF
nr:immunoglobulin light chain junction region [Macaca mulatta]MOW31484.1 immunoglobulin light chain junction region [Macaca mulatta]